MSFFRYGQTELEHLKSQDHRLGAAMDHFGFLNIPLFPDLFSGLLNSIVAQQISSKAAATVWKRIQDGVPNLTPEAFYALEVEQIQQFGLSMRKAGYIHSLSSAILEGSLDLTALQDLPDVEVIRRLSSLPGIGVWTAEMILIFALQRPDVVSWSDLGIRRGMSFLYGHDSLTRDQFESYRLGYSPFGSVASFYLWEIAEKGWVDPGLLE